MNTAILATYVQLQTYFQSVAKNRRGATMVEYALLILVMVILVVGAVKGLGTQVNTKFSDAKGAL